MHLVWQREGGLGVEIKNLHDVIYEYALCVVPYDV